MSPAIQELERRSDLEAADVEKFLEGREFPLQEGRFTTFVYRGEADSILLRHWIYGLPSSQPLTRLDGTDLWYLKVELPQQARIEYKFDVVRGEERKWLLDPFNPLLARDPFGANSVCQTAGYEIPGWTLPDPEARPGSIQSLTVASSTFGDKRTVRVYLPPRYRRHRTYPLLVVHDGSDFLRYAGLQTVLDNLIFALEIPPLVVALTDSPDRLNEYAANERHGRHIVDELLPALAAKFSIDTDPSEYGLLGSSFGAVAALATAWRHPGRFGRLLVQSGSFAFSDVGNVHSRGPVFDPVVEFMNTFRDDPGKPVERIFISCGIFESLIYENRSLVPLLQASGMDVRYVEARDGHNWENWRDRLREGLSWLFPGPLWMVYE